MPRGGADTAKYVYGVVRAPSRAKPKGKGIDGKPLRVVAAGSIGALTSEVPDEPLEAGRDELLTHARVLEKALENGAVLPMRFGVVMPDDAAIRDELLAAHRPQLEEQLAEMDGKVEVNVKALYDEATLLHEVLAENRDIAALRQATQDQPEDATYYERIRLGELVAAAVTAKRERDEEMVIDRLAPHAVAMQVGEPIHERMVANASFLVESERSSEFDDALEELAAEQHPRIGFKLTGPLPPHSFVELTVGV
jgi:Gas vesicle synthesis protein GvpL/GvpF